MKKMTSLLLACLLLISCAATALGEQTNLEAIYQEYCDFLQGKWECSMDESMLKRVYGSGIKGEFTFSAGNLFVDASGCAYYYMTGPIVRLLINPDADKILLLWGDTVSLSYSRQK